VGNENGNHAAPLGLDVRRETMGYINRSLHLDKRKGDGAEIFKIKKQRWVRTWMNQPHPVMLVIGTFAEEDERTGRKDKLGFAEVRWMEITSVLKKESADGTKPVKQIEFKGERLDMSSVRAWRDRILQER